MLRDKARHRPRWVAPLVHYDAAAGRRAIPPTRLSVGSTRVGRHEWSWRHARSCRLRQSSRNSADVGIAYRDNQDNRRSILLFGHQSRFDLPTPVECTTGHLPALVSVVALIFHSIHGYDTG